LRVIRREHERRWAKRERPLVLATTKADWIHDDPDGSISPGAPSNVRREGTE